MARRILGGLAILLIAAGIVSIVPALRDLVSGWLPSSFAKQTSTPAKPRKRNSRPVPVKTAVAVTRPVPIHLEGVGTVKARSIVAIKSRIEGQLFEALVREGQTVWSFVVLFRLDPRPLQARLKEVEAILARNRASHAKAIADVKRLSNLSAKGYSPKTLVDDAKTLVDTLAATVRASSAGAELAQLNLDYATIRSPIDGRVGSILITAGNIVKANDTQPLLIITETKPVYASFGVPEQYIDEIRTRMATSQLPVLVSTQGKQAAATGRLFFINNQVDSTTGTIELLAHFDNRDEWLVPGQFIRARILLSTLENAVLVPRRAVQINQAGQFLWVVRPNGIVELRPVVTGPDDGDDLAITKGLAPGERVVTDGQLRLFPGATAQLNDGKVTAIRGGRKSGKESKQRKRDKGAQQ
ncbi:MAG: efflux RND transporter periplasmic adaptor subunit [Proteobacteria bacterium]|nr:efflux RND transporter periplasmic adaptor subunit [Pseudomonadota bacterium]